jgi:sarcosine oxidase gamma subunit
MEHISVMIVCEAENRYTLMALRSYAASFLHALEVSIKNVGGNKPLQG